ncbi:hypothetical protein U0070_016986 [Myodes glareolus]|uniref:Uncharacterized protein n=1 Tax=Myodes glareolus TaxID=447135 RepID=A0AAW0IG67_MYOGA
MRLGLARPPHQQAQTTFLQQRNQQAQTFLQQGNLPLQLSFAKASMTWTFLFTRQTEGLCVDEEEPDITVPSQWKQKQASGVWTSEEKVENEPMYEKLGDGAAASLQQKSTWKVLSILEDSGQCHRSTAQSMNPCSTLCGENTNLDCSDILHLSRRWNSLSKVRQHKQVAAIWPRISLETFNMRQMAKVHFIFVINLKNQNETILDYLNPPKANDKHIARKVCPIVDGVEIAAAAVAINGENSQKANSRSTILPTSTAPWHVPKALAVLLQRDLLGHVSCCPVPKSCTECGLCKAKSSHEHRLTAFSNTGVGSNGYFNVRTLLPCTETYSMLRSSITNCFSLCHEYGVMSRPVDECPPASDTLTWLLTCNVTAIANQSHQNIVKIEWFNSRRKQCIHHKNHVDSRNQNKPGSSNAAAAVWICVSINTKAIGPNKLWVIFNGRFCLHTTHPAFSTGEPDTPGRNLATGRTVVPASRGRLSDDPSENIF